MSWKCKKCGCEWVSSVKHRKQGKGCPCCSGRIVVQGINDLASKRPDLVKEWDFEKNRDLKPTDVSEGMHKVINWKCSRCGYEYKMSIFDKRKQLGCKKCNPKGTSLPELAIYYYLSKIYKDVLHRHKIQKIEFDIYIPSLNLAIEYDGSYWHKDKIEAENKKDQFCKDNGIRFIRVRGNKLNPTKYAEIIWMKESAYIHINKGINDLFDYLNINHSFIINIERDYLDIININSLEEKENNITITHPEIAKDWNYDKNNNMKPEQVSYGSRNSVWWKCHTCGYEWYAHIYQRCRGYEICPLCKEKNKEKNKA